jgi:hypothetical protein
MCAHACGFPAHDSNYNWAKQITDPALRGIALAISALSKGGHMLWILAVLMGGLSFGYVTIRRRRKAEQKTS